MTGEAALGAVAQVAARFGRPAAELTASGTAAIEVALEVLGVGPGDEVVVPDLGCHAVAAAVVRRGCVPVFVGVGESLTLTAAQVGLALSDRTRAVIAVHQYGLPCDVAALAAHLPSGVAVIEDAAQTWFLDPATAAGVLTVTSFGPGKPVSLGAGGALLGPADLVTGTVSRGDGRESQLPRPLSSARFPVPLLDLLPAAIARADAELARRRARMAEFHASGLAERFRLPPGAATDAASWTAVPLYPTQPVTAAVLRAVREALGPVELLPRTPPSAMPMFASIDQRMVPGPGRSVEPLIVTLGASTPAPPALMSTGGTGRRTATS